MGDTCSACGQTAQSESGDAPGTGVPEYELMYFPVPGAGEPLRLTMTMACIPFKDTTPKNDENFATRKESLAPYGQLPLLLVHGKAMPQARAILRYLGKIGRFEGKPLYPEDPMEAYRADELIDLCEDVRAPLLKTFAVPQAEREAARAKLFHADGDITKWLVKLDKRLGSPPARPTIGDIYAFCALNLFRQPTIFDGIPAGVLDQYINIAKHHAYMSNLPLVKAYYANKDDRASFQPLA